MTMLPDLRDLTVALARLAGDARASATVEISLAVAAATLFLAVLAAPLLHYSTRQFVNNDAVVDRISTGSVEPSTRYTIRRSVLAGPGNVVCLDGPCPNR
jgi:hypothetical protein